MNRAQAPAHVLLLAACAWAPACGLNQAGVDPPSNTIAYPASAVMDRTGEWLLVTNSNADLRFNDGSLMAFSLRRAAMDRGSVRDQCPSVNYPNPTTDEPNFCCRDALDPNITNCDERSYVGADGDTEHKGLGNVRIGSFAAGMVLQTTKLDPDDPNDPNDSFLPLPCPPVDSGNGSCSGVCDMFSSPDDRLLIGVRGDTSLTFVDIESTDPDPNMPDVAPPPPKLKCVGDVTNPQESVDFATCDDAHRVITATSALASATMDENPPLIPLPDEPYALAFDALHGLVFIGHLSGNSARAFTGGFSLFDVAPLGQSGHLDSPRFIAPFPSPFTPNSVGSVGITALTNTSNGLFASSRYVPQVAGLGSTAQCPGNLREIAGYPNGNNFNPPLVGTETRGIRFVNGRAFVLQRSPPALVGFQGSTPTDVLETCGSPTFLDKYPDERDPMDKDNPNSDVRETRLFVTCFADGEIYVYDPSIPRLVKTFLVGRGPSGLVFDKPRKVAYVVGFGDNNISVIDLDPANTTQYHVVQRIGFPRVTPR